MTRRQIIVDTETTGLDSSRHQIWELALIERHTLTEHLWRMKPDLVKAEPSALAVGRYYERTASMLHHSTDEHSPAPHDLAAHGPRVSSYWSVPSVVAQVVAPLLDGATLIAANPTFDAGFLTAFLNKHGQAATWHYRLKDIGSMAWGYLRCAEDVGMTIGGHTRRVPPMDAGTDDFAKALGVDLDKFERHSAVGDCRLVSAMLAVIDIDGPS